VAHSTLERLSTEVLQSLARPAAMRCLGEEKGD
jgi:hypothetical protein